MLQPVRHPSQHALGVAAILTAASAMGTAGMFGRLAQPGNAVIGDVLTLGRMATGLVGMSLILVFTRRTGALRHTRMSGSVAAGGLALGLALTAYLTATMLTGLTTAVALLYTGPLVSAVLARVFLGERLSGRDGLGLSMVFVGMLLTTGAVTGELGTGGTSPLLGDLLAAASGLLYGLALFCYRLRSDMDADVRSFWNFGFGTLACAAVVALSRPDLSGMSAANWVWAAVFFVVAGLVALGLLVVAGGLLRSAELSGLSYAECVVATLIGVFGFHEPLSGAALIGMLLIVTGGVLPVLSGRADRAVTLYTADASPRTPGSQE